MNDFTKFKPELSNSCIQYANESFVISAAHNWNKQPPNVNILTTAVIKLTELGSTLASDKCLYAPPTWTNNSLVTDCGRVEPTVKRMASWTIAGVSLLPHFYPEIGSDNELAKWGLNCSWLRLVALSSAIEEMAMNLTFYDQGISQSDT